MIKVRTDIKNRTGGMKFNRTENARTKLSGNSYPTPGQLLPFKISAEIQLCGCGPDDNTVKPLESKLNWTIHTAMLVGRSAYGGFRPHGICKISILCQ
jgi:hypothetical protein